MNINQIKVEHHLFQMAFLSSPSTLVRWLSYCLHPPKVTKSMPDETFLVSLFVLSITEITWYHVGVIVSEDAKLYPRRFDSQNLPTNRWHIWVVTKLLRPHSRAIDNQVIAAGKIEARVYKNALYPKIITHQSCRSAHEEIFWLTKIPPCCLNLFAAHGIKYWIKRGEKPQ